MDERLLGRRCASCGAAASMSGCTPQSVRSRQLRQALGRAKIPTRTVVWCVGARPDPLVDMLNLPTRHGRLVVDPHLAVPNHDGLYSARDVAAVPDPAHPQKITSMTAQHAQRQGKIVGINIAAALGHPTPLPASGLGLRRRPGRSGGGCEPNSSLRTAGEGDHLWLPPAGTAIRTPAGSDRLDQRSAHPPAAGPSRPDSRKRNRSEAADRTPS